MLFELLIQDTKVSDTEKVLSALDIYFSGNAPSDIEAAINGIEWFYLCGQTMPDEEGDDDPAEQPAGDKKASYSFEHDAPYIYAAFQQIYGIDLTCCSMHWWKFRALFKALPDTCEFIKIVGYRSMEISNDLPDSQKRFYRRMQRLHALPMEASEKARHKALVELLKRGGDPTDLI